MGEHANEWQGPTVACRHLQLLPGGEQARCLGEQGRLAVEGTDGRVCNLFSRFPLSPRPCRSAAPEKGFFCCTDHLRCLAFFQGSYLFSTSLVGKGLVDGTCRTRINICTEWLERSFSLTDS